MQGAFSTVGPVGEITVYECVACEGRGRAPDEVRHLITCPDGSETKALTFPVGDGPSRSPV